MLTVDDVIHTFMIHSISLREETVTLRQQQEEEFQQAMETDRRMRETKLREEEERVRREEEESQRLEEEQAMLLSQQLARQSRVMKKRAALPPEPGAEESDVAMIRFHLPSGSKAARRFRKTDLIQVRKHTRCNDNI